VSDAVASPDAAPLRVAVIGAGARAQDHLAAIARLPRHWQLLGICDARAERAQAAATQYGVPAFGDPLELLDAVRPNAALVIVPPDGHHPLVLAAAERGVHVLTEVPISISLPLADLMIDACRRHQVILEVAENVWRRPVEQLRREVIRRGLLGNPTLARLSYTSGSYHGLSAVLELLDGQPEQVWGWRRDLPTLPQLDLTGRPRVYHDWEFGLYRWPRDPASGQDGPTLLYEQPPRPGGQNAWEIMGPGGRTLGNDVFLAESSDGVLRERRFSTHWEHELVDGQERPARLVLPTDPPIVWENPLLSMGLPESAASLRHFAEVWQLLDFHQAILSGSAPRYGAAAGRRDLELLIALRESARQGSTAVALPLRAETEHERALHASYRQTYGHDPLTQWRDAIGQLYPRGGITHGITGTVGR
jgi:predicted dehydrogenase